MDVSRIAAVFKTLHAEGKKGFIPFITAGDPDLETTRGLIVELARIGATLIELGVPFSDPMADGPVIQRASERALRHGFGLTEILQVVVEARKQTGVPIVLFSYFNPLLQFGITKMAMGCKQAGVDGVLVTDLTSDEAGGVGTILQAHGIDKIFLVAPTSADKRLKMVAERATGFIYAVSRAGVTGAHAQMSADAENLVKRMRKYSDLPIAVGFGISNREQVAEVLRYADAAVVGSAIVAEIERLDGSADLVSEIGQFAGQLIPSD